MHVAECASCGGRFTAKRQAARFCSDRCRKRAKRAPDAPPLRQVGAAVVALPAKAPSEDGLLATTRRELEQADRLNTSRGQAALLLATVLDSGVQDTGSSIAALVREHRAAMKLAMEGVAEAADPIDAILARRRSA